MSGDPASGDPGATVYARAAVPFRRVVDRVLVGDPSGSARVTTIAGPAARIWDLLDQDRTLTELSLSFGPDGPDGLDEVLAELVAAGVVERRR